MFSSECATSERGTENRGQEKKEGKNRSISILLTQNEEILPLISGDRNGGKGKTIHRASLPGEGGPYRKREKKALTYVWNEKNCPSRGKEKSQIIFL